MTNFIAKYAFAGLMMLSVLGACKKEYAPIEQEDAEKVSAYIQANNLTSMTEYVTGENVKTGIYYQILQPGTGAAVANTDFVYMTFTVKTFDGSVNYTDENLYRYSNYLGYLEPKTSSIPEAFRIAVKDILKKKGGKIRFLIPSNRAYGTGGTSSPFKIGGNESLDCTVTLYDVSSQTDFEDVFVKRYLGTSISEFTKTASGLYYKIIAPGTGTDEIFPYSKVSTVYKGKLIDGTVFDENTAAAPFITTLLPGVVIEGWAQGIPFLKKGGKIRLVIPPALGYQTTGSGKIGPNAILDFDIEVTDVNNE